MGDYVAELNRLFGGEEHYLPCKYIEVYFASDGFAIFYLPSLHADVKSGVRTHKFSQYTLNEILQSLHFNFLQLHIAEIGKPFKPGPIDYSSRLPEMNQVFFSKPILKTLIESTEYHFKGLTLTPIMDVEEGIVKNILPGRIKIWCPEIYFPVLGKTKYFLWDHVDVWWHPENMPVPNPKETAKRDFDALKILQRTIVDADYVCNIGDANSSAAKIIYKEITEFSCLLDQSPREEIIHQWLKERPHFLDPSAKSILSKVPFGKRASDFLVRHADDTYELVEIETAQSIFTDKGKEPCARFHHACTQCRDWLRYVNENLRTVEREQELPGIYKPRGRVIMGRSHQINCKETRDRFKHLKSDSIGVNTYDELIEKVRNFANSIQRIS